MFKKYEELLDIFSLLTVPIVAFYEKLLTRKWFHKMAH